MENQKITNQSSIPTQIGNGVWLADHEHGFYWGEQKQAMDSYHSCISGLGDEDKSDEMIRYLATLIKYTREELKDYFTVEEALLLVASTNGTLYNFAQIAPKGNLYSQIIDSAEYETYAEDFRVDVQRVTDKIVQLTEFQSYVVYHMCFEYLAHPVLADQNNSVLKSIFGISSQQAKS